MMRCVTPGLPSNPAHWPLNRHDDAVRDAWPSYQPGTLTFNPWWRGAWRLASLATRHTELWPGMITRRVTHGLPSNPAHWTLTRHETRCVTPGLPSNPAQWPLTWRNDAVRDVRGGKTVVIKCIFWPRSMLFRMFISVLSLLIQFRSHSIRYDVKIMATSCYQRHFRSLPGIFIWKLLKCSDKALDVNTATYRWVPGTLRLGISWKSWYIG